MKTSDKNESDWKLTVENVQENFPEVSKIGSAFITNQSLKLATTKKMIFNML